VSSPEPSATQASGTPQPAKCWSYGTTQKTTQPGATATFDFTASGGVIPNTRWVLGAIMAKGPDRGRAAVFLDGTKVGTVNTYSDTRTHRTVVWRKTVTPGDHELRIVNRATSGRERIDVDAFVLIPKDAQLLE
jgi:hypothetical protein